jgi:Ala-tRNA(Pro) deacylase
MMRNRIFDFLDKNNVKYMIVEHSPAYAATDVAKSAHIADWELAKTVIVKLDGQMAMAVLSADERVDLDAVTEAAGAKIASAAHEDEFKNLFPDCEPGTMPPFGNLYNMPVYADDALAANDLIAFNAGTHHTLVRMHYGDFARLAHPKLGRFKLMKTSAAR